MDTDWIRIGTGIQSKMLDPDPDQINRVCYVRSGTVFTVT
jgi:hypothetical protein